MSTTLCVYVQYRSEDDREIRKFRFDTTFEKIVVKLSQVILLPLFSV